MSEDQKSKASEDAADKEDQPMTDDAVEKNAESHKENETLLTDDTDEMKANVEEKNELESNTDPVKGVENASEEKKSAEGGDETPDLEPSNPDFGDESKALDEELKDDSFKDEDGGNILDDILNNKEEKFEDEDMKKDEDEEESKSTEKRESLAEATQQDSKGPISDLSDSSDDEELTKEHKSDSELSGVSDSKDSESESERSLDGKEKKKIKSEPGSPKGSDSMNEKEKETTEEGEEKEPEEEDDNVKKKGKSYDYATKLNYLFRDSRFFLVKSNNAENVSLAKSKGVWSTPPQNESKFNQAFGECRNVLLIYSVKESGKFCGLARLATESRRDGPKVSWILPAGLSAKALGGVFKIDWICRGDLSFQKVQHLYNPWNEGKPVKIGRDGQEIEPRVAEELCRLFTEDSSVDMTPILRRSKEAARCPVRAAKAKSGGNKKPGPLGGMPGRSGRGGHYHQGGDRGRKRPRRGYEGDGDHHRNKYHRYESDRRPRGAQGPLPPPAVYSRGRSPPPARYPSHSAAGYSDYLRSLATHPPPPPAHPYPGYPHYAEYPPYHPPPSRYYDVPPLPTDYRLGRQDDRNRSYDRSVDEFLRRTADRSRERERDRRYRR